MTGTTIERAVCLYIQDELEVQAQIEFKFHPKRRWRADIAIPSMKVLIEIHGGIWTQGRHTTGSGFLKDREKMNAAQILGWKVLEYSTKQAKEMSDKIYNPGPGAPMALEYSALEAFNISHDCRFTYANSGSIAMTVNVYVDFIFNRGE